MADRLMAQLEASPDSYDMHLTTTAVTHPAAHWPAPCRPASHHTFRFESFFEIMSMEAATRPSPPASALYKNTFCIHCHDLDLNDPALKEDLSEEQLDAGFYLSWGPDDAEFNILGQQLQPDNPRLTDCTTCTLLSGVLVQLDPVLGAVRRWAKAEIFVHLDVSGSVELSVNTGLTVPGPRYYELYTPTGRRSDDLPQHPGDDRLWEQLASWLSVCSRHHDECFAGRIRWNPTRLVRVENDRQYLVVTSELPQDGTPLEYVALSHCWGREQPLRTLKQNLSDHISSIPSQHLPRLFLDSLAVVRKLGKSYLWIDSLCIVQDDREDWARESQMMSSVYEQAYLTVSATVCENGAVAFLGREAPCDFRRQVTFSRASEDGTSACFRARRIPDSTRFEGPIMSRAWTLQERFFSRRIIHFTRFQTQWKCRRLQASESGPTVSLQRPKRRDNTNKTQALNEWHQRVFEYSQLSLTNFSDKLPAISGLAAHLQPDMDARYWAGLWDVQLSKQLAWCMELQQTVSQDLLPEAASGLAVNRPPSWSWASVNGTIWKWVPNLDESYITIAQVTCNPSTSNKFGEVESNAFMRLQCRLAEIELDSTPDADLASSRYISKRVGGKDLVISFHPDCLLRPITLAGSGDDQWAGRATTADDGFMTGGDWTAKAMLMPLVAERTTPPCCLLLGKQPGFGRDVFQRLGFLPALLSEEWHAVEETLTARDIVLR